VDAVDLVIVGSGLAGLSVASFAAKDRRVLVLDQGSQAGAEASSQNAGMVRRLGEDPHERALALRSAAWLADPPPGFEHASRVSGALIGLVLDPTHLNDAVAHLRAAGVRVEACDRPADVAPATRGARLSAAWWLPDERVADPHALLSGFTRVIRRHNGRIQQRVRVEGLVVRGGRVEGVRTSVGTIHTDQVVFATGAWSAGLAAAEGLDRPLIPLRRTLIQTAPHALSDRAHPWTWLDDVGVYARPESGGWLVSGCDEIEASVQPGPGSRGPVEVEHAALAVDKLARHLPALADAELRGGWTGLRTFAPDRRPVLGPDPDLVGLAWATGLGGFGVTCCVAAGEAVAAWIRGEDVPWLRAAAVSPGRQFPRRWPVRTDGSVHGARLRPVRVRDLA
jgi:glycine/D-amino acid oxidase-like deaminating enzyme